MNNELNGSFAKTPLEACKKYAVGSVSREELIEFLVNFPYVEGGKTDGYDSLIVDPPGTWSEISQAVDMGLISEDLYEEVFDLCHG